MINSMVKILSILVEMLSILYISEPRVQGETQALHINSGVAGIEIKSMRINKITNQIKGRWESRSSRTFQCLRDREKDEDLRGRRLRSVEMIQEQNH